MGTSSTRAKWRALARTSTLKSCLTGVDIVIEATLQPLVARPGRHFGPRVIARVALVQIESPEARELQESQPDKSRIVQQVTWAQAPWLLTDAEDRRQTRPKDPLGGFASGSTQDVEGGSHANHQLDRKSVAVLRHKSLLLGSSEAAPEYVGTRGSYLRE